MEKTRKRWTQEENEKLCKMFKEGKSVSEIAKELGRVSNAVLQQFYFLKRAGKIKGKLPTRYHNAKKVMIRENGKTFNTHTDASRFFDCSAPTITARVKDGKAIYGKDKKEYHLIAVEK